MLVLTNVLRKPTINLLSHHSNRRLYSPAFFTMKKAAMLPRLFLLFALCSALPILPVAHAGQNCEGNADTAKTQRALRLASQVRDSLELSGAAVALISRVGSDQSKRGFRYTHTGYVVKDPLDRCPRTQRLRHR